MRWYECAVHAMEDFMNGKTDYKMNPFIQV